MTYKIALLCARSPVPRSLRMARILANAGYVVHLIEWDRTGLRPRIEEKNGIVFRRLRLKGPCGLRSFYLFPVWIIFSVIQLIIGNYHIIQPQCLDSMVQSFFYTKLIKRASIIYDLADFYRDAYLARLPTISWIFGILEKLLIRCADAVIIVSKRQVLQVEARNLPAKVLLFYNGPDVNFSIAAGDNRLARMRPENNKNGNMFTLLYAGGLSYERVKILLNVINAIKSLPVKIVIAGYGEYEDLLRRLSEANKQVIFLGYLDHGKAMEFIERADLILLPYDPSFINYRIALANKFFEAMACGSLMLAPLNTYMGEIVERERIGIVVDYSDPAEIRRMIKSVIGCGRKNIQLYKENAKRLYIEKYNPEKINIKYLKTVESLVSKQSNVRC